MRILLLRDWEGAGKGAAAMARHRAGDVVSVYHVQGLRMMRRQQALWVGIEEGDPAYEPPSFLKAPSADKMAKPQHDKMLRGGANR